jgi:hypothetical protein
MIPIHLAAETGTPNGSLPTICAAHAEAAPLLLPKAALTLPTAPLTGPMTDVNGTTSSPTPAETTTMTISPPTRCAAHAVEDLATETDALTRTTVPPMSPGMIAPGMIPTQTHADTGMMTISVPMTCAAPAEVAMAALTPTDWPLTGLQMTAPGMIPGQKAAECGMTMISAPWTCAALAVVAMAALSVSSNTGTPGLLTLLEMAATGMKESTQNGAKVDSGTMMTSLLLQIALFAEATALAPTPVVGTQPETAAAGMKPIQETAKVDSGTMRTLLPLSIAAPASGKSTSTTKTLQ